MAKRSSAVKKRNAADLTGRNNNARKLEIAALRDVVEVFAELTDTRVRALEVRVQAIDRRLTKVGVD